MFAISNEPAVLRKFFQASMSLRKRPGEKAQRFKAKSLVGSPERTGGKPRLPYCYSKLTISVKKSDDSHHFGGMTTGD